MPHLKESTDKQSDRAHWSPQARYEQSPANSRSLVGKGQFCAAKAMKRIGVLLDR